MENDRDEIFDEYDDDLWVDHLVEHEKCPSTYEQFDDYDDLHTEWLNDKCLDPIEDHYNGSWLCNACKTIFKGDSETFVHRGLYREHVRLFETLALSVTWSCTLCVVIYNEDVRQTGEDDVPSEVRVEYDVQYHNDLNNFCWSLVPSELELKGQ